jgi:hypothetical protein
LQATETQRGIYQLAIGGFFFAMRSCEYLKVKGQNKRRTDIMRLADIRFLRQGEIIHHDDPKLEYSNIVAIMFRTQKKEERDDTVNQRATNDTLMCPVRDRATIDKRIRSYPGANDDTAVSAVWANNCIEHITSDELINAIDAAAESIGCERLGLRKGDLGLYSIRAGAAMAMYLDKIPIYTIVMIGRWSSDVFLQYNRKQVESFSHNVAK